MFVQIHTLRDYSTALQNRGQDGLAKRSIYGGIERQRISSQCIKAAMRDRKSLVRSALDDAIVPDTLKDVADEFGLSLSIRSALIADRKLSPAFEAKGIDAETAKGWAKALMGLWRSEETTAAANTPIVVGERECEALVEIALALREADFDPADATALRTVFEKTAALNRQPEAVQNAVRALRAMKSHVGIDGAMFGRMATGIAVRNVDSCVHVAHALTVHPLASISDFFSVQDLEKTAEDGPGGSHINTSELTSGLFYGYTVVDLRQMAQNFAELTGEQRGALVAWIIRAFATVEPAAKRGSTAPYAGLRECVVEIGRRQPRTLIGAFERPVEPLGDRTLSETARDCLAEHITEMDGLMGGVSWRGTLRDHLGDKLPAIEALAAAAADHLPPLAPAEAAA